MTGDPFVAILAVCTCCVTYLGAGCIGLLVISCVNVVCGIGFNIFCISVSAVTCVGLNAFFCTSWSCCYNAFIIAMTTNSLTAGVTVVIVVRCNIGAIRGLCFTAYAGACVLLVFSRCPSAECMCNGLYNCIAAYVNLGVSVTVFVDIACFFASVICDINVAGCKRMVYILFVFAAYARIIIGCLVCTSSSCCLVSVGGSFLVINVSLKLAVSCVTGSANCLARTSCSTAGAIFGLRLSARARACMSIVFALCPACECMRNLISCMTARALCPVVSAVLFGCVTMLGAKCCITAAILGMNSCSSAVNYCACMVFFVNGNYPAVLFDFVLCVCVCIREVLIAACAVPVSGVTSLCTGRSLCLSRGQIMLVNLGLLGLYCCSVSKINGDGSPIECITTIMCHLEEGVAFFVGSDCIYCLTCFG